MCGLNSNRSACRLSGVYTVAKGRISADIFGANAYSNLSHRSRSFLFKLLTRSTEFFCWRLSPMQQLQVVLLDSQTETVTDRKQPSWLAFGMFWDDLVLNSHSHLFPCVFIVWSENRYLWEIDDDDKCCQKPLIAWPFSRFVIFTIGRKIIGSLIAEQVLQTRLWRRRNNNTERHLSNKSLYSEEKNCTILTFCHICHVFL